MAEIVASNESNNSVGLHCAIQCEHGRGILDLNNGGNGIPESGPRVINMGNGASGNPNQQWHVTLAPGSDTTVNIRNPRTGWLLYSQGNAQNLGCTPRSPEDPVAQWDMVSEEEGMVRLQDYRGQIVRLRNKRDDIYIDLWEMRNEDRAPYKCGGKAGNNQRFKLIAFW